MIQSRPMLITSTNETGANISDARAGGVFQATIAGSGEISCLITIQASLDSVNWVTVGTIVLSGTTSVTDAFVCSTAWVFYRAVSSATMGTISSIIVNMSEET